MNVAAQSAAAKENFAIWYSYYRTRIALIKSAASLAFSPLNDTKRIGFITMQPKSSVGAAGINPLRFLPVGDFTPAAGGQKDKWFAKLFEQIPAGASPAREGLARVGRYYGGKEDSINTDMPATGANDPIQYTCQQNFAIMTTDGYWNGQTESRGAGLFGGGLQLDGVTKVGQQDGDLSDPYSPRPIWDGTSNSIHVVTNKTNAYTDNVCSLSGTYRSTFQHQREVSMTTKDSTLTTKRDDPVPPGEEPGLRARPSRRRSPAPRTCARRSSSPCTGSTTSREVPARQVGGADDQGHRAVGAADEPGRGADLPDAQDRHPGMEDRGAVADGQVAIRADDDPVRHAERPVQARPQAGLPPPVPDARQVRR